MATVEETLVACLKAAVPSVEVRPDVAAPGDAPPYIVYTQYFGSRVQHLGGDSGLANPRFQIDIYASSKPEVVRLKNQVRAAIDASAELGAFFIEDASGYEPDTKRYRHRQDFSFWFRES
jgi:hypothetical protein